MWKDITARAVGGREEMWVWKVVSSEISVMVDIVAGLVVWGGGWSWRRTRWKWRGGSCEIYVRQTMLIDQANRDWYR